MSFQIILLLLANTETATTSGLQTFFQQSTILGINPTVILWLSISWSLRTSVKLHVKAIKTQKVFFGVKASIISGLWGLMSTLRRIVSIVGFFTPSLGLFSILNHWLAEQYTFPIRRKYNLIHPKDEVHLFNSTKTMYWKELDRWNYFGDIDDPTPPSYILYTGLTLQWTFVAFFMLMAFQFIALFLVKTFTSAEFKKEENMFNKCIHILQNTNYSSPFQDWDEGMFPLEEYKIRYNLTETEMALSFAVNNVISIVMLLPIWYTGK